MDRKPAALSGGQRQRVALARAIVREPTVFLMDEPLSNLDAKLRVSTRAQIKNLQHELKTTTIYVTHDQIEAMTMADRIVVMSHGEIQQVGTPEEVYNHPANTFVASFIGSPAMNLTAGELKDGVFTNERIRLEGLPKVTEGPVTLGYRAEDANLVASGGDFIGPIFSTELLGDATMVTCKVGDQILSVKTDKDFRAEIGDHMEAKIDLNTCHLFDAETGERLTSDGSD